MYPLRFTAEHTFGVFVMHNDAGSFDCVRLTPHFAQDDSGGAPNHARHN